jgi:hypothetical protein
LAGWVAPAIPARASDLAFHGLLDVVFAPRGTAYDYNVLTRGDSPFDAYGARVFADGRVSDQLTVFAQVVRRDATALYVDGAYASYQPLKTHDLSVMAGKVPWAIGTYAPRTYSNKNPLVGTPLMYQYHTSLIWYDLPPDADALLATAGQGSYGVDYFGYPMGMGMPIVDDSYWDVGVTVAGSARPVEYALGAVAGTPGWGSTSKDENSGKSLLGRIGIVPMPGLRVGASAAYGPYLVEELNASLPAGRSVGDYHQRLAMVDLELQRGHVELRAEGAFNVWETPTVGDLKVKGGYAELKYLLPFGAFVAGRWDALRFGEIANSSGQKLPWDCNVTRIESGFGYRFSREAVAKVIYQRTDLGVPGTSDQTQKLDLIAAQLSIAF